MTTLRQLRFLAALAQTENFSRAAEICHVTQSTLSTGLKELEARLGVQVAERSTHSVMMTAIGRKLAERAEDILARVDDFEELARAEVSAGVSEVRMGIIPTIGPFLLPRALPMLRQAMSDTRFLLREELTQDLVDGLTAGRLDLILIALPHELPPTVETHKLFDDGYSLATARDHPLANLDRVEGRDLEGRDLLLLEKGHCLQKHALESVPGVTLQENADFSATSLPTLVSMVEEGIGVTLLPTLATDAGLAKGHDLNLARLIGSNSRQVVLAWRRSSPNAESFAQIGDILEKARRSLAPN